MNVIEKILKRFKKMKGSDSFANMFISDVIRVIKEVEKEYNNGWIPCSERLPKYDEEYFEKHNNDRQYIVMCNSAYEPTVAYFSKEKEWYYNDFVKFNDVIAWQPLPDPYKESEKE